MCSKIQQTGIQNQIPGMLLLIPTKMYHNMMRIVNVPENGKIYVNK